MSPGVQGQWMRPTTRSTWKSRRSIPTELCFEYVVSNRAMPVRYVSDSDRKSFANAVLAVLSVRFHGLPTVRLSRGREPSIHALVAGLQTPVPCSSPSEQPLSSECEEDTLPQPVGKTASGPGPRVAERTLASKMDHNVKIVQLSSLASPVDDEASVISASSQGPDRSRSAFNAQQASAH